MLSNMRGQESNELQLGKHWIGHQAQQVKQAANHILEKEITKMDNIEKLSYDEIQQKFNGLAKGR
ncbi:hypothetical protein [Staphylococcus epidermidis]|nr:hypothetical protein [Staphylococcus epidermidis]MBE7347731.1 hypothetical protein [Staphylococcus epidermidis]MCG2083760.1 hypothetical protein [Staphylococcus epidermidis]MCG2463663.1 hypothetical protein [Staphylococcus epidermidis]